MRICVLIGNGFDLALGLKTGYKSFVQEYLKQNKDTENADIKWLCNNIEADLENWGDAEMAFGRLQFSDARKNGLGTYQASEESFSVAFQEYLQKENARFSIPLEKRGETSQTLVKRLFELSKWMTAGHAAACRVMPKEMELFIDFLNFNYTDTLSQILGVDASGLAKVKFNMGTQIIEADVSVCHVHGTLDRGVLFGVDSADQIKDGNVQAYCSRTGETIKPRGAEVAGFSARSDGIKKLGLADVVVSFGLSFGASDKGWWQKLWENVFGGKGSQLIVCPYSLRRPAQILGNRMVRIYADEKKKVFHSFAGPNEIATLESATADRIIVLLPMHDEDNPYDYFYLRDLKQSYLDSKDSTMSKEVAKVKEA